ncbi:kinase-like domain-containing protein [Neohortaea acidophila]|uniref:Kinase-like domain-containing protein n=1 Tax=Neohortaea acidophila TaxID=245834 RepID=A0A6A6Q040_9PEZI|nr:kinase-like domain-containing protein [Neohortaea acidophila]KAF2485356.1 kinase-like domain-containing protein [Neohortaea acidophila]
MAGEIRQKFDLDKFTRYVDENAPNIKTPLEVKQFGYGQSNPTYLITAADGNKYVMRKQPPGKLLSKTAHRVDREFRIIHALNPTDVPVPEAMCLCTDSAVIGTPFYIMQFLQGRIFEDPAIPDVSPKERKEMWRSAITTLAKFHRVKPDSVGLQDFGRHGNFYNRQLRTFKKLSEDQAAVKDADSGEAVGKIPYFDEMVGFFGDASTQPQDRSTFVHGDYKIDNVVFHPTEPRVIGILDWEMATIGHPLSDLTNLIMPISIAQPEYAELADAAGRKNLSFMGGKDGAEGLPTKEEAVRWYEDVVGWKVDQRELTWAEAFNAYRGAVIMQGIAARYAARQASSTRAMEYGRAMGPQGKMSWAFVQEVKKKNAEAGKKAKL